MFAPAIDPGRPPIALTFDESSWSWQVAVGDIVLDVPERLRDACRTDPRDRHCELLLSHMARQTVAERLGLVWSDVAAWPVERRAPKHLLVDTLH